MGLFKKLRKQGPKILVLTALAGCSKFQNFLPTTAGHPEKNLTALSGEGVNQTPAADQEVTNIYHYLIAQKYSFEGKPDRASALFRKMLDGGVESVELLNAAALEEMNLSHFDEALVLLERALTLKPEDRTSLEAKARVLTEKGDFSTALVIYSKLLNDNPEDEDLVDAMVQIFVTREDFLPAERLVKAFLEKNPGNEYGMFRLGMIQRASGKILEARKTLEELLRSIPDSYQAAAQLARVYDDLGEKAKALELYEWLARSTNNANYHWMLALMYTEMKRFDDAIRAFENLEKTKALDDQTKLMMLSVKAHQQVDLKNVQSELKKMIEHSPENENVKVVLAEVYQMDGKTEDAINILSKIDSKDHSYAEALSSRMKLLFELKRTADLKKLLDGLDLDKVILDKDADRVARLYAEVGFYYAKLALFDKAHATLDRGLEILPKSVQLHYMRGLVFEKQELADKAVSAMEEVIALNPKHAAALNFIGYSWAERGVNLDRAETYIRRALATSPNDAYMMDSLGWVLYRRGHHKEALAELKKAQEALPKESIVASHLGDVYMRLGELNEARRLFKIALELGPEKEAEKISLENKLATLQKAPEEPNKTKQSDRVPSQDKDCDTHPGQQAGTRALALHPAPCVIELRDSKSP